MQVVDVVSAEVGARVRQLRLAAQVSLADLAQATGVSKAHLSRVENGDRGISLTTLMTIASGLGVSAASLLPPEHSAEDDVVRSAGPVVRANDLEIRPLTNRVRPALQPFRVLVPPQRVWDDGVVHEGEEWIYVLRGYVSIKHGNETHTLGEGDSLHFDATQPHRISSQHEAELIVVTQGVRP